MQMKLIVENWRGYLKEAVIKGNVLEGIVAAALGAMIEKGADIAGRPSHGGVATTEEILNMIGKLAGGAELVEYTTTLASGDTLKVAVELKSGEIAELLAIPRDPALQKRYKNELDGAHKYVNEKRFRKFANRIARRSKTDVIEVIASGKAQKGKEDIQILINGKPPPSFGSGISLKGMSKQFGQAVVTLSGSGQEIENFKKGLDKDVGLLKELAPTQYDQFKDTVATLMAPIVGSSAVAAASRKDVYAASDRAIAASGVASDLKDWINKARNALFVFLEAVAASSNTNPQTFATAAMPLIKGAVGNVEFAQMGRKLSRGRMEPLPSALERLISKGGTFGVANAGAGEVNLTLDGAPLLSFRFRRDASKSTTDYKLMLRLLVQSTSGLKDLLSFGGARKQNKKST
jgi:hypothetical protein